MTRLIIVPTGISLFENARTWISPGFSRSELKSFEDEIDLLTTDLYVKPQKWMDKPSSSEMEIHTKVVDRLRKQVSKVEHTTAEIASLYQMQKEGLLDRTDRIVFICPHIGLGLYSALFNAHMLQDTEKTPVCIIDDYQKEIERVSWKWPPIGKWTRLEDFQQIQLEILPLKHINPLNYKTFKMDGVGELFDAIVRLINARGDKHSVILNITCGFKALIPILTMSASWLDGVDTLVALFQNSEGLVTLPVIKSYLPKGHAYFDNIDHPTGVLRGQTADVDIEHSVLFERTKDGELRLSLLGQVVYAIWRGSKGRGGS